VPHGVLSTTRVVRLETAVRAADQGPMSWVLCRSADQPGREGHRRWLDLPCYAAIGFGREDARMTDDPSLLRGPRRNQGTRSTGAGPGSTDAQGVIPRAGPPGPGSRTTGSETTGRCGT
jgi:hypothetical protein